MTFILRRRPTIPLDEEAVKGVFTDGFDSMMKNTVSRLLTGVVSQALAYCMNKYTEEYYHLRMAQGFSYVEDWRQNHGDKFATFIKRARKLRGFMVIDEDMILNKVEALLNSRGWRMYPNEKEQVRKDIAEIKRIIYS